VRIRKQKERLLGMGKLILSEEIAEETILD